MENSSLNQRLCSRFRLWHSADQYILEPLENQQDHLLSISRMGGNLTVISELPSHLLSDSAQTSIVYGIMGILRFLSGVYALVITGRKSVGLYCGSHVYQILSMKFLPCTSSPKQLSVQEKKGEAHLCRLLKCIETTSGLYLSYEMDLTHTMQQKLDLSVHKALPLWKQADPRFLWNRMLLDELINAKCDSFVVPVIQGSFNTIDVQIKDVNAKLTLIARRCIRRIGTRMWRRGADMDGNVANFVESEQILEAEGHTVAYVQVRGSIPVMWEQIVDLTYKPKIEVANMVEFPNVAGSHFKDLNQRYGSVVAIDLVNQHGSEGVLSVAYGKAMQSIEDDNIRYVPFDFHKICGQIRFDRLSILYDQVSENISKQRYFHMNKAGEKIEEQKGVLRTNCVDCLDRTNVTQSLFGRKSLESQLQKLGVFAPSDAIRQYADFDNKFKVLWADHGDNISIQYSGTPALKGDFVRYGKRTGYGIAKDGYNSLARYYYNNLYDGTRQDALDLAAGHYTVSRGMSFHHQPKGLEIIAHLPMASALIIAGMALTAKSFGQARQNSMNLLYSTIWAGLTLALLTCVRSYGRHFVNKPSLSPSSSRAG